MPTDPRDLDCLAQGLVIYKIGRLNDWRDLLDLSMQPSCRFHNFAGISCGIRGALRTQEDEHDVPSPRTKIFGTASNGFDDANEHRLFIWESFGASWHVSRQNHSPNEDPRRLPAERWRREMEQTVEPEVPSQATMAKRKWRFLRPIAMGLHMGRYIRSALAGTVPGGGAGSSQTAAARSAARFGGSDSVDSDSGNRSAHRCPDEPYAR